jgi:drug/metabolite transporter (DMT)-like permease
MEHLLLAGVLPIPISYLLALLAAVMYAVAALLYKRAAELGVGVWRTAFVSNIVIALMFQMLWGFGGRIHWHLWWQPALLAVGFIVGQGLTFLSLERGDVSVSTPVMGIKILLVAIFVTLINGELLRPELWIAAVLATVGIALLSRRGRLPHRHVGFTIVTAGLAAATFALFDVAVQNWSPEWGLGSFLPLALGLSGILSLAFIPRFASPLKRIPRAAWPWLLAGSLAMGMQSLTFVSTLAYWGQAAQANVMYSSRGLWSVLLVWGVGHWFRSREQHLGRQILTWRLAGATLMMVAILLVLRG